MLEAFNCCALLTLLSDPDLSPRVQCEFERLVADARRLLLSFTPGTAKGGTGPGIISVDVLPTNLITISWA